MKICVIHYPGSNCAYETEQYFRDFPKGITNQIVSVTAKCADKELLESCDLVVLPGGFAYGDRVYDKATESYVISPGTMALESPVTRLLPDINVPIIGICNGFQILTGLGLLPGSLGKNKSGRFECQVRACTYVDPENKRSTELDLWTANSYGEYIAEPEGKASPKSGLPVLYYKNAKVAGVYNPERKILGLMPHPERTHGSDGHKFKELLYSLLIKNKKLPVSQRIDQTIIKLMHSEHISYKSTKRYLKNLYTSGDHVVQGPGENAGIIRLGNGWCLVIRIESHNHPTYINPFEGAATGVGGILRDIFTMGARPIAIMDFLRFADEEKSMQQCREAMEGIAYYGNCVGVANIGGDLRCNPRYSKNPLVNVMAMGLVKEDQIIYGRAYPGSLLVYVGAKTGRDGIGGAAMASQSFSDQMNTKSMQGNIQKSDPFLEKLLLEACCELAEGKMIQGMQDMGAGGLLCATVEVLKRGTDHLSITLGCTLDLDQVPTKCQMEPEDILVSESQERMLIVCTTEQYLNVAKVFDKWDLEHHQVGAVNTHGTYNVHYNGKSVYQRDINTINRAPEQRWLIDDDTNDHMRYSKFMSIDRTIYDATVGNRTIRMKSGESNRTAVVDIPEADGQLHVSYGESFHEVYESLSKADIKPLCAVNCLNYGHPSSSMRYLKTDLDSFNQSCKEYGIPIVGGNVSLYNNTDGTDIIGTPVFVLVGFST